MENLLLKYKSMQPLLPSLNATGKGITEAMTTATTPHTTMNTTDFSSTEFPVNSSNMTITPDRIPFSNLTSNLTESITGNFTGDLSGNLSGLLMWNAADFSWDDSLLSNTDNGTNLTDGIGIYNFSDFDAMNTTIPGYWFCAQWTAAQQDLFQTAHIFIAMAFLVPHSFKRSILLVRALLALGFLISALWAGSDICAPDVMIWNFTLMLVNVVHGALLIIRFIPPTMSVELADLYLRLFKPLRVSKKHFSELTRDARVLLLEAGEPYALEEVSPADERLSILLRGKLKVSCDGTHLHYINPHQFIDSPEWEANHEHSDDVFQVSIMAEEDCYYLCWPRMKLERVLRHRPCLKVVLDSIIGKDITGKLYSLNEHLGLRNSKGSAIRGDGESIPNAALFRSISVDAVYTGTRGRVRSDDWKAQERRDSFPASDKTSPGRHWFPYVARHFPEHFPFPQSRPPAALPPYPTVAPPPYATASPPVIHRGSDKTLVPILAPPPPAAPRPMRRVREVKFAEPKEMRSLKRSDQPV